MDRPRTRGWFDSIGLTLLDVFCPWEGVVRYVEFAVGSFKVGKGDGVCWDALLQANMVVFAWKLGNVVANWVWKLSFGLNRKRTEVTGI